MVTCLENIREEKKILTTEGFYRKSTFCTLVDANPGFDRHWVMPEIFLLNGTFTMLEMTAFLLNTFFNSMHWCKSATLKIANLAILNHYMVLLNQCMELKKVFNKKAVISSIVKVPFSKNIFGMTQWPSNPGFVSVKAWKITSEDFRVHQVLKFSFILMFWNKIYFGRIMKYQVEF